MCSFHDRVVAKNRPTDLNMLTKTLRKSKLAIRYAEYLCRESPDTYIFWVNSATKDTFLQGFRRIHEKLGLPVAHGGSNDMAGQVSNWLSDGKNGPWLMILDNADDYYVFRDQRTNSDVPPARDSGALDSFLPQTGNGRILITSRSRDAATTLALGLHNIRTVQGMEEEQAKLLLRKTLGDFDEKDDTARELVHAMNCIPLSITQAAAYIQTLRPRMTCGQYVKKLKDRNFILLGGRVPQIRHNTDAKNNEVEIKTWQITFDQIRQERQSAAELLSLMCFFQPQGIPQWVLQKHYTEIDNEGRSLGASNNDKDAFEDDVGLLRDYSLVAVAQDGKSFQMHSLVQSFTRSWLKAFQEEDKWKRRFRQLMAKTYPETFPENWAVCGELTPHVEPLVTTTSSQLDCEDETVVFVELLNRVGAYNNTMDMYETALRFHDKAGELAVKKLDRHHVLVYQTLHAKAVALMCVGLTAEAEKSARRAYRDVASLFGLEDPLTLQALKTYAVSLERNGKPDEAQGTYLELLESGKRAMGPDSAWQRHALMGLGRIARETGNHIAAEKLFRQTYEANRIILGMASLETLESMFYLSESLINQGKYAEAEPIVNELLKQRGEILSPGEHNTLLACSLQATILVHKKRFKEAEDMYLRVLEAQKRLIGAEHSNTLFTQQEYRDTLAFQGKWDEAEGVARQLWETRKTASGSEHRDTLLRLFDLGIITYRCGRTTEATDILRQVFESQEDVLGLERLGALCLILPGLITNQCRLSTETVAIIRQISGLWERAPGPEHPATIYAVSVVEYLEMELGQLQEAQENPCGESDSEQMWLGGDHPVIVHVLTCLGLSSTYPWWYEDAYDILRRLLDLQKRVLGPEHPKLLDSMNALGCVSCHLQHHEEAESIFLQRYQLEQQIRGPTHLSTLMSLEHIGSWYVTRSLYDQAETTFRQVIETRKQVLPLRHTDVLRVAAGLAWMFKQQGKNEEAKLIEDQWHIYNDEDGWCCTSSLCFDETHPHLRQKSLSKAVLRALRRNGRRLRTMLHIS